jgi:hypothetical protein
MSKTSLIRTLSHVHLADEFAQAFKPLCNDGDTILNNYFIRNNQIIFSFVKNDNGIWSNHTDQLPLSDFLKLEWTHNVCPNKIE